MSRKDKVTDDDVHSLVRDIELFVMDAPDFADRIKRGYSEPISDAPRLIRELTVAARNFSELSLAIMAQVRMAEQDAELTELRRKRDGGAP